LQLAKNFFIKQKKGKSVAAITGKISGTNQDALAKVLNYSRPDDRMAATNPKGTGGKQK